MPLSFYSARKIRTLGKLEMVACCSFTTRHQCPPPTSLIFRNSWRTRCTWFWTWVSVDTTRQSAIKPIDMLENSYSPSSFHMFRTHQSEWLPSSPCNFDCYFMVEMGRNFKTRKKTPSIFPSSILSDTCVRACVLGVCIKDAWPTCLPISKPNK